MASQMTYEAAVDVLTHALKFGIDPSLGPIGKICKAMGDPQDRYSCIQVTGTNGKTSTSRMIAALLRAQGLRVGLYVSPHLIKYPERMEVDGEIVDDASFARAIEAALAAAEKANVIATEFELLTAGAFWLFAEREVDWAVLECGMGGRWDATSMANPKVAVITGVALEHTEILGDTLEKIATEKAAIIKPGSSAVLAHGLAAAEVFIAHSQEVGASHHFANPDIIMKYDDEFALLPEYQRPNIATAITAVYEALGSMPSSSVIQDAFASLRIPGRFEVLSEEPLVIIDAAHNPQSAHMLAIELSRRFVVSACSRTSADNMDEDNRSKLPTLLLGVLDDKDAHGVVNELCPLFERVVVTASRSERAIPANRLAAIVKDETGVYPEVCESVIEARRLLGGESILATGSITIAGEVKDIWC